MVKFGERAFYEYQECCCGETLDYIAHGMRSKNSNSVVAMCKTFIYHAFLLGISCVTMDKNDVSIGILKEET